MGVDEQDEAGRVMLTRLGPRAKVKLVSGKTIALRGAVLYDEKGTRWGKNSILIAPSFEPGSRLATDAERSGFPKEWLGRTHVAHVGSVEVPPRAIASWETLGDVDVFYYVRSGKKAPGGYRHKLNAPRGSYHIVHVVKGKGRGVLRKHGAYHRIDFYGGSLMIDSRGLIWP